MIQIEFHNESIELDSLINSSFAFFSTYLGSNHLLKIVVDMKKERENMIERKIVE